MSLEDQGRGKGTKNDINDEDPNICNGGTLFVTYASHLNVLACLFIMLSSKVSIL